MQHTNTLSHELNPREKYVKKIFQRSPEELQSLSAEEFSCLLHELHTYICELEQEKQHSRATGGQIRTHEAIQKGLEHMRQAKQEWESTADSLAERLTSS